ncbi:hypothetical protein Vi05172_g6640 [Venturia inaequalis]|nr:hypothetical protein Vi05172_g6640 [Venturia inaequalis]
MPRPGHPDSLIGPGNLVVVIKDLEALNMRDSGGKLPRASSSRVILVLNMPTRWSEFAECKVSTLRRL